MRYLIAALLLVTCSQMAKAEGEGGTYYLSGNDVAEHCSGQSGGNAAQDRAFCDGFIVGVADFYLQKGNLKGCFATDAENAAQLANVVTEWLIKNPAQRRGSAVVAIGTALEEGFPCKK